MRIQVRTTVFLFTLSLFACSGSSHRTVNYPDMGGAETMADFSSATVEADGARTTTVAMTGGQVQGQLNLQLGAGTSVVKQKKEKLVVEGWLTLTVNDVGKMARSIRERVEQAGGRVVDEQLNGDSDGGTRFGSMKLRVPPEGVDPLLLWVAGQGKVSGKRIRGTEVSRQLFEQEIALENFEVTLKRLRQLLNRPNVDVKAVLTIEKEMTRVRGQIESIKGQNRFLKDRVAMATITISITRDQHVVFAPDAKFHPGPRFSSLLLTSPGGLKKMRLGGGATLHFKRSYTLDFDAFPDPDDEGMAVLTTMGGAVYSEFLGNGQRSFLNPFIGFRMGYGYLNRASHFVAAAEIGLELFKNDWLLIDTSVRALSLIGSDSHFAVQGTLGVAVPF